MSDTAPAVEYSAPGRINLIGEHTDYNHGFALPIALPERTVISYHPADTDALVVRSDRHARPVTIPLHVVPGEVTGWAAYVAGVLWVLRRSGLAVAGGSMSITGGVEMGSGLASSAALECAALGAILTATGQSIDRIAHAQLAQRVENEYVGAPTGLLDQLAILFAEPRRAQLIDFRSLTVDSVAFDPDSHDIGLLLINSRATHRHVDGEYVARRASCERSAADLGVPSLRDVQDRGPTPWHDVSHPDDARRARHIITENQRVLDVVEALGVSDFSTVGRLLTASHSSMRDDFQITTEQLDLIADAAVGAGALGARMTGGGFGGCVIALVEKERMAAVDVAVRNTMQQGGFRTPIIVHTHAGGGAGPQ